MGTWGDGLYDNDSALDSLADLVGFRGEDTDLAASSPVSRRRSLVRPSSDRPKLPRLTTPPSPDSALIAACAGLSRSRRYTDLAMVDETLPPGQFQARLANERTLLAWLRTAVALMGFGVMIARLGVFLDTLARSSGTHAVAAGQSRWTGAALLLTGSVVALIGYARTRAYAALVAATSQPPRDRSLHFTALLVTALGIALALFVVFMN